jgi:Tfp pilus assembly protein PilO
MDFSLDLKGHDSEEAASASKILSGAGEFLLNFLIPLVCLGATAFLVLAVALPSRGEIPGLESELERLEMSASKLENKVTVLKSLVDSIETMDLYSVRVDQALISESKVPELLSQVDRMVGESGMSIGGLSYSRGSRTVEEDGYNDVGVALSVEGSFDQLVAFLRRVEQASRLVLIDDFRYSVSSKEGVAGVSASFRLHSPYLAVQSDAVTDEPIDLDVSSESFLEDMETVLNLNHYDIDQLEARDFEDVPEEDPSSLDEEEAEGPESPVGGGVPGGALVDEPGPGDTEEDPPMESDVEASDPAGDL